MTLRIDYSLVSPDGMQAVLDIHGYIRHSELDDLLVELVYFRVSQLNKCAYCLDLHARQLLKLGIKPEKLVLVQVWDEGGGLFDERERAALTWCDVVTRLGDAGVPAAAFEAARTIFEPKELVDLTIAVGLINMFNRLAIAFCRPPKAATATHGRGHSSGNDAW